MKLYVGNLPFSVDEEGLKKLFSEFNPEEVTLIINKFSNRSKGFGFVTIADEETAKKALSEMNGKEVEGRKLTVNEARPMEERSDRDRPPRRDFGSRSGSRGNFNNNRRRY